ncbi:magnesium transporter CorA [Mucilaginibacter sp. ZT4R22]|uniref:Magnesium transporter CorA n=1 Tax=Mucilaginibacter pankratovii TaxID=2772110 RepID=A0ABR7WKC6_9SPHI|nr:CorA family divalent cation transporter [Mucilaginibacter pankratovii]MBD1362553.1 magnesium transporter CorA [Mucilaginibacter pankratovii]
MVNKIISKTANGFEWMDITAPSDDEFAEVAKKYKLHPALVKDCLQPDHLPKFERLENYSFIIFRICTGNDLPEADSVQELTHKIAIFYADDFILTIHRKKQTLFDELIESVGKQKCTGSHELLNLLINACLGTYDQPLKKLSKSVDYYEEIVFLRPKNAPLLKGLYYLKRKIDLLKQMLILSYDIIDNVDSKELGDVNTRDTRDQYIKFQNMFSSYSENIHQLLNIYFSASSQRTNETMRILTIFSVFFMPLTFIVGIYGMNFDFMPELKWKLGYPGVMLLMAVVTVLIYIWFKKKKWL